MTDLHGVYKRWYRLSLAIFLCLGVWLNVFAQLPIPEKNASLRVRVPRVVSHLTAQDIGLVINSKDPYSVEVGQYYIQSRKLSPRQVLHVELPIKPALTPAEFKQLSESINTHFGREIQVLALAWVLPYAVNCNSITGALALGFDARLCSSTKSSCTPSTPSPYFNSVSSRPFSDLKFRPSMLLAAKDIATAKQLIDRGIQARRSLGLRGAPPVHAYFTTTQDQVRSTRTLLFPPAGPIKGRGVEVHVEKTQAIENAQGVLIYETGAVHVDKLNTLQWVPGALADHLTSYGGQLDGKSGQMSALEWINSGATASYGTVSEPCAHPQKFPHPQILLLHYMQGATAIEAYWKSVAWPLQGVFIGEPLAAPFAR